MDLLILMTISDDPKESAAIELLLEKRTRGMFQIRPGSLLKTIERLEDSGLLAGEWRQTDDSRQAKFYALTNAGREKLEAEKLRLRGMLAQMIDGGTFRLKGVPPQNWN